MRRIASVVFVFSIIAAQAIAAPTPSSTKLVASGTFSEPHDVTRDWAAFYYGGQWDDLQRAVKADLHSAISSLDFSKNVYSVVIATKFRDPKGELIRFLVSDRLREPYSNNLQGTETFREIFVTTKKFTLTTFVTATPVENPQSADLRAFLKALPLTGVAGLVHALALERTVTPPPNPPPVVHDVLEYEASLPSRFATVALQSHADTPEETGTDLAGDLKELRAALVTREAHRSACTGGLNEALYKAASDAAKLITTPLTGDDRKTLTDGVHTAYDTYVTGASGCTADDVAALIEIETQYANLVSASTSKALTANFTHDNLPLRTWDLELLGGAIFATYSDERSAKNSAGTGLDKKSLRGEKIVGANFAWQFVPYDPTALNLNRNERWRAFAGIVSEPELGIDAGIDYALYKQFALSVGFTLMRVDEPKKGSTTELHKSTAGGWFVGFSVKIN
jgi:hypothetical protein